MCLTIRAVCRIQEKFLYLYHLPFFPSRKCLYIKQEQDQEIYQEKKEIIKESEIAFFATFPPKFSTFQQTFNKVFNNNCIFHQKCFIFELALLIGKNLENVENYEFSTFCGKLVAEGNRFTASVCKAPLGSPCTRFTASVRGAFLGSVTSVPLPPQNVRARRALLHFLCARRVRFMRRRALHLRLQPQKKRPLSRTPS